MGHTERYGVRLRFECNRVTHLLHRDAGTACLRGARYAPTDPMESAKRALDGSQPVDGARELEPRTLVQNRHLGAPFSHRIRAHENNNVPQAARSRLAPVRWCRAALGGQAGCMAPPVARFAALASPGGGIEHGNAAISAISTRRLVEKRKYKQCAAARVFLRCARHPCTMVGRAGRRKFW